MYSASQRITAPVRNAYKRAEAVANVVMSATSQIKGSSCDALSDEVCRLHA